MERARNIVLADQRLRRIEAHLNLSAPEPGPLVFGFAVDVEAFNRRLSLIEAHLKLE